MVRGGLDVIVQDVPPVRIRVIIVDVLAVLLRNHHPGALGILHLVIPAGPQFLHVRVGVVGILGTRAVGAPEEVVQIDGVIATGLVVGPGGRGGDAEAAAVGNLGAAFFFLAAALGGHEDHAGRATGTIDGCCGGVLDDGDALHVHGVDILDVTFHAVNEDERAAPVDGVPTTDVERGGLAGTAGTRRDVQARDGTLEHVADVQSGTVLEFVGLHHGDGAGEVFFLLGTVAHDHGVFQDILVLLKHHQELAAALDGHLLRHIAEAGNFEDSVGIDADGEGSIRVRCHAGTAGKHDGPDDGAIGIRHRTAYSNLLGKGAKRDGHTEKYGQYAEQFLG